MQSSVRIERASSDFVPAGHRVRPLRDRVLIKPVDPEHSSALEVVDGNRKPLRARVVAVGPGCRPWRYNQDRSKRTESRVFVPPTVKPGDIVELGSLENGSYRYDFPPLVIDNELHFLIQEADICCVIEL